MSLNQFSEPAGIYVHIPFCERKCPYCDFYSICDPLLYNPFFDALVREIELAADQSRRCDTVYFGGGTPTVMGAESITAILEKLKRHFDILPDSEITIEANPGTVTRQELKACREAGITRINIGVQSFDDDNLKFLGRIHTAAEASAALKWAAEAGFDALGLDLIYGLPGQTIEVWQADLQTAFTFAPDHLSCYTLTIEPGTPLERDFEHGLFQVLEDGQVAQMLKTTVALLADSGYRQYEVSNFARRPTSRSRHNLKYWTFVPYLGLGPSAHSFEPPVRRWNKADVIAYIKDLERGDLPEEGSETLTRRQMMIEAVYLGLRLNEGINVLEFEDRFQVSFSKTFGHVTEALEKNGLLNIAGSRCALTTDGLVLMDSVVGRMVECL
jgi:oxygen-independent coproporphyrinogen-3 oxidase